METEHTTRHDIVVKRKGPGNDIRNIPDTNRAADPLRFPLFFPTGIDGWHTGLKDAKGKRITCDVYYKYYLQMREPYYGPRNIILRLTIIHIFLFF